MDKSTATSTAIIQIRRAKKDPAFRPEMISAVCACFDYMKDKELSRADRLFLHYIANQAGLPHYYYPMLGIGDSVEESISLQTLSNYIHESSLMVSQDVSLHRYQKEILDRYSLGQSNRFFLSASTSFGKTFLVYEIIRKMQYRNIILIFPTIALLSENLAKVNTDGHYSWIKANYKVHTMSDVEETGDKNIFMYTPERYLSFKDKNADVAQPDFVFVDEAYKIDNGFVIDEEEQENERDVTYRIALYYLLQNTGIDCLLAAPYVEKLPGYRRMRNRSFGIFLDLQQIKVLNYNRYEIVGKSEHGIATGNTVQVNDDYILSFEGDNTSKTKRFVSVVAQIINHGESLIAYAYSRTSAENYAKKLIESDRIDNIDTTSFEHFLTHLEHSMNGNGMNWVVTRALRKGIGIHHGLVPKYIQKEIIDLFNRRILHTLVCTTTITEGVNTQAKNIVVLSHKKGGNPLKKFDAKNIEGRAGRFLSHYQGRVFILDNKFTNILAQPDEELRHKFYDTTAKKSDVDLFYIGNRDYLNNRDQQRKEELNAMLQEHPLPDEVLNIFTTISVEDKLALYKAIENLSERERSHIDTFVRQYHDRRFFDTQRFDMLCSLIRPIVHNADLCWALDYKVNDGVCLLAIQVKYYLRDGLNGCIIYRMAKKPLDTAVQESTKLVYNTLKYQVVKYLGLFNLIYKVMQTRDGETVMEDAKGIDYLLSKFEYNADTLQGRMVSDLGAPQTVVDYFDSLAQNNIVNSRSLYDALDDYEKSLCENIKMIINDNE